MRLRIPANYCANIKSTLSRCLLHWRKRWDSNPRALADNRISSAARCDHFDTLPNETVASKASDATLQTLRKHTTGIENLQYPRVLRRLKSAATRRSVMRFLILSGLRSAAHLSVHPPLLAFRERVPRQIQCPYTVAPASSHPCRFHGSGSPP